MFRHATDCPTDELDGLGEADTSVDGTACALFNWIIKPIPGTRSICVEGKKE